MKKISFSLLLLPLSFTLLGCVNNSNNQSNNTKGSNDNIEEHETSGFKVTEAKSEEISGTPNGKVTPEIDGKEIDTFFQYDSLTEEEQNKVVYDYLLKALVVFGGDLDGTKNILSDCGYPKGTENLSKEVTTLREDNPNDDFNQIMIKLVEFIMKDKEN